MEISGILKLKYDTQKVSDKFQKRDFVLTTESNTPYPQQITFQLTQEKCKVLDNVNVGEHIIVRFNLRGREWYGPQGIKYFNTIEAWNIQKEGADLPAHHSAATANPTTGYDHGNMDNDDLPF